MPCAKLSECGDSLQTQKMLKMKGDSGNVYENKGPNDNVPDTKYDISAWLNGILHKDTRVLQKLTALS